MKIKEKIEVDWDVFVEIGPVNIVAFGDSVTHGAVAGGEMNYETVYWNRLRKKILEVNDYIPVNVIDAGICGITAKGSVKRIDSQVLCHRPDLVIVCFGLNDVNGELEDYVESLGTIFDKCIEAGAEVIFMTPNMLNTYVSDDTDENLIEYATKMSEVQNSGKMDLYINSAIEMAKRKNVKICDCYAKWKELSKTKDTTMMLANRINHPTKEMHELFAQSLFDIIFE